MKKRIVTLVVVATAISVLGLVGSHAALQYFAPVETAKRAIATAETCRIEGVSRIQASLQDIPSLEWVKATERDPGLTLRLTCYQERAEAFIGIRHTLEEAVGNYRSALRSAHVALLSAAKEGYIAKAGTFSEQSAMRGYYLLLADHTGASASRIAAHEREIFDTYSTIVEKFSEIETHRDLVRDLQSFVEIAGAGDSAAMRDVDLQLSAFEQYLDDAVAVLSGLEQQLEDGAAAPPDQTVSSE